VSADRKTLHELASPTWAEITSPARCALRVAPTPAAFRAGTAPDSNYLILFNFGVAAPQPGLCYIVGIERTRP
jgi:hypothetical protein